MQADIQKWVRECVHASMKEQGLPIDDENYAEILHNMLPKIATGEQALYVAVVAEITSIEK